MAKPLSPRSTVIRDAIAANPDLGNTDLAALINGSAARKQDKITVTATDVNNQKQALKAMAQTAAKKSPTPEPAPAAPAAATKPQLTRDGTPRKKPGRKPGYKNPVATPVAASVKPVKVASAVGVVESVFGLAEQVGGMAQLKRLVDRLAAR
jgi:hypothetical protein